MKLLDQVIEIAQQFNQWGDSRQDIQEAYQQAAAERRLTILQEQDQVVAFLEWCWIQGPQGAQEALEGVPTTGPCLYVKDLYVAPGQSHLIWRLRRRLPPHEVLYCHRAKYGQRLDCHHVEAYRRPPLEAAS